MPIRSIIAYGVDIAAASDTGATGRAVVARCVVGLKEHFAVIEALRRDQTTRIDHML